MREAELDGPEISTPKIGKCQGLMPHKYNTQAKKRLNISSICKNANGTILFSRRLPSVDSNLELNVGRNEMDGFNVTLAQYLNSTKDIMTERGGKMRDMIIIARVSPWVYTLSKTSKGNKDPAEILSIRSKDQNLVV